jgi:hypothetical protein
MVGILSAEIFKARAYYFYISHLWTHGDCTLRVFELCMCSKNVLKKSKHSRETQVYIVFVVKPEFRETLSYGKPCI